MSHDAILEPDPVVVAAGARVGSDVEGDGRRWWMPDGGKVWILVIGAALLPMAVLIVKVFIDGGYANWGDNALLELQVRDVGRAPVLLGPYSRFGFAHPGPMMFYLLALPYWLVGGQASGLNLGTLLINSIALAGVGWIAWRRGGYLLLGATLLVFELFIRHVGGDFVRQPWNPYLTVLPFALMVFIAWEVARGERWALPAAVVVGSFLVQSHLGYLPAVATLSVAAGVLGWREYRAAWRGEERRALTRAGLLALGLFGLLWLAPGIELLMDPPGNIGRIAGFQLREGGAQHSLTDAVALVLRYVANIPAFFTGRRLGGDGTFPGTAWMAIPMLLVFVATAVLAIRRRATDTIKFYLLVSVALVISIVAVTRINGPLYEYLTRWTQVSGLLIMIAPVVLFTDPSARSVAPRTRRSITVVVMVALAIAVTANVIRVVPFESPGGDREPVVAALAEVIAAAVPAGTRTIVFDDGGPETDADEYGVAAELVRGGYEVRFPRSYRTEMGAVRTQPPGSNAVRVVLGSEDKREELSWRPGARELGSADGVVVFQLDA